MNLQNLTTVMPDNAFPVIRVYKNSIHLNGKASLLLGLAPHSRINVRKDADTGNVYIYRSEEECAYRLSVYRGRKGKRVNSNKLAAALSDALSGYGAYRISEDWGGVSQSTSAMYRIMPGLINAA